MKDKRVRSNPAYMPVLILSKVILRLGSLEAVTTEVVEKMFTADMDYLKYMYHVINDLQDMKVKVRCPECGAVFTYAQNFTKWE